MDSCPPIMSRAGLAGMTDGCRNDGGARDGRNRRRIDNKRRHPREMHRKRCAFDFPTTGNPIDAVYRTGRGRQACLIPLQPGAVTTPFIRVWPASARPERQALVVKPRAHPVFRSRGYIILKAAGLFWVGYSLSNPLLLPRQKYIC